MSKQDLSNTAGLDQRLNPPKVLARVLTDDGIFPNSELPLLLYRQALVLADPDPAAVFEQLFAQNNWRNSWRNGIYSYAHYHSTSHEVLGVFCGSAKVQFGGDDGVIRDLHAGDVVIIPAGVAHKNLGASSDFGVVGAYPDGREWDMNYGKPGERPRVDENIAELPLPRTDPLYGADGPLLEHWAAAPQRPPATSPWQRRP